MSPDTAKSALRRRMRSRLAARTDAFRASASDAVRARVFACSAWRDAGTVALFASLPDEVETSPAIVEAWRSGRRVLLPRVVGESRLDFHEHHAGMELVPGAFALDEPASTSPRVDLGEADLVIVPGLAFDRRGGRLGRGAGYYDRALAAARSTDGAVPTLLGIGFGFQLVDEVPMESFDVRLDAIVTESEHVGDP